MTQIPPRGTPEFEEYKKTVEEAAKQGASIQIGTDRKGWMLVNDPNFKSWDALLYRIAPNQPQSFQNQQQEPSITPTEQRIVKALDQVVYALCETYGFAEAMTSEGDARIRHLHDYIDKASQLVTALVADLPLPSPSATPSEAVAPQQEARNGGYDEGFSADPLRYEWNERERRYVRKDGGSEAVQFASHAVGDRVRHFATGWTGVIEHIDSTGTARVTTSEGLSKHYDLCILENLTRKEAIEAAGAAVDKVLSPLSTQVGGDHYKDSAIQPVEFITANNLTFLEGGIVKRICRHRRKNGLEDLRKAIHEIELLIELEYGKEKP